MAKVWQNELDKTKIGDFRLGEFPWKGPKCTKIPLINGEEVERPRAR